MQKTILITGANRGLGLEFCRQYATDGWRVIAACRSPAGAAGLLALAGQYPDLSIHALDVADFAQIDSLAEQLADEPIDVLLNNAGVFGDTAGRGFGNLDYAAWASTLQINTLAPVKMAEAFLPHVERGQSRLIASVSSLMGSLADNTSGGSLLYRSSKAGLNAAMKTLSFDLRDRGVAVLMLHPGWVKTDMGGRNALIEVEESIGGMRRVMADFSLEQTGSFIRYDGKPAPW
ncbi:MAG: SDR family oxidoreductase [Methylococcales bacterium]|nr:SDR family oxidoreductase [Methylococcales bacterium]